ncbi:hypothetical protein ACLK19_19100 [Escherichia coli]
MKKAGKSLNGKCAECQNQQGNLRRGVGVARFSYTSTPLPVGVEIAGARLPMHFFRMEPSTCKAARRKWVRAPTPSSRKWWQKPWGFRLSDFRVISREDPRYAVRSRICLTPEDAPRRSPALRSAAMIKRNHRSRRSHAASVSDELTPDKAISCWLNDRSSC